jgi:hypothetical protein
MEIIAIISLLSPKAPKRWPFAKWSWKCSLCPLELSPNQDGCLKQPKYHEP